MVISLPPFEKTNLSALKLSVTPSSVMRTYLSSSKDRNVSSDSARIVFVALLEIVTSYCFLIVREELVRSVEATFLFGKVVYKVLSEEDWKLEKRILKSLGLILEEGRAPSHTPETVVIPEIVKELWDTVSIFAKVLTWRPGFENATIFPTVAIPEKMKSEEVTVLIPPPSAVISTWPILKSGDCLTSAVKVDALPTIPYKDFTSFDEYAVIAVETLVFSIPSKINFSPITKVPFVLYAVIIPEFVALYLKNPTAPLDLPLMWVGDVKVIGSF